MRHPINNFNLLKARQSNTITFRGVSNMNSANKRYKNKHKFRCLLFHVFVIGRILLSRLSNIHISWEVLIFINVGSINLIYTYQRYTHASKVYGRERRDLQITNLLKFQIYLQFFIMSLYFVLDFFHCRKKIMFFFICRK